MKNTIERKIMAELELTKRKLDAVYKQEFNALHRTHIATAAENIYKAYKQMKLIELQKNKKGGIT